MDSMINYPKKSVSILKTSIAYKNNYFDVFTKKETLEYDKAKTNFYRISHTYQILSHQNMFDTNIRCLSIINSSNI